jgi:glycosyltransferase involved in cell wall biosynthesis
MNIGLNGYQLTTKQPAGPDKYTINLFKNLPLIDRKNKFIIYAPSSVEPTLAQSICGTHKNIKIKVVKKFISWTHVTLAVQTFVDRIDVLFTPVHTLPLIRNPFTKVVGMLHGLEYTYSLRYKKPIIGITASWPEWLLCAFSNKLIVPSTSVKNALVQQKWPLVSKDKILVVYEGIDINDFQPRDINQIEKVKEKYGIGNKRYLYAISTIQPRKNYPALIKAFSIFLDKNPSYKDVLLVISGKKGWEYEESISAPRRYNIQSRVKFLEHTPDNDLQLLLAGCLSYVSVSFEEGFGLPVLEAFACARPCLLSDITTYKELAGKFPIYVDPYNVNSIAEGIARIVTMPPTKESLILEREVARGLSWEKVAKETLDIIENV